MTPREEWHLETRRLGRRVLVYDCVESTNTLAAGLADDPGQDGLVVLAAEQSSGRGQHGRSWHCPAGSGVLLSVLLFPPPALRRPVLLAAWAAVAVCETIRRSIGAAARVKWPNDVLVQGRKVCGILIEQGRGTVVGIGLNVNQSAEVFAAAGLPDAGSLALFADGPRDCRDMARLLITQLDAEYQRLLDGDLASLEERWAERVGLLDREVLVEGHTANHRGRLREMAWDGLLLETPDGTLLRLLPETVRHLWPADGA